ncbi:type II and III secretion system protein [Pedobacter sp. MC2016-14]|uniref:type II secretion system protein GspD n=1 Tax=Pedobacter sp. MC2016-14 TaxID=2897327 RepID=UPI001E4D38D5|nr:type II and III secretion system protein [Pedobacter sp. MC2016-14]MCD0487352.1 type II and III secretion system protein [Pedobacter sp. MC2016-14]
MRKLLPIVYGTKKLLCCILLLALGMSGSYAQTPTNTPAAERVRLVQERLNNLAITVPGLNQKVQMNVSGVSAQEFLRALAQANNLNINIDPQLTFKVFNNFTNETALNVLVFLAKEYGLDINLIGSIMSVTKVAEPRIIIPLREIKAKYNAQNNTLSVELNNDTLAQVARKITQVSGKNVVVPGNLLLRKVTAFLADAPFETALEKLAYANDLKMVKTSDNVYLFQALGEGEELYINSERNTAVKRNLKPVNAGAGGANFSMQSRTLQGKKLLSLDALNVPINDVVKQAAQETNASYFLYSDLKGSITIRVNDITYDNLLAAVFQGTDFTFRQENGVYLIGDRRLEGLRAHKLVHLQNRSLDTIQTMIPQEWKRGVEIKEFREQNTILLSGAGPQITEIEAYIRELDKMVPMILIEVTMIDIRKGKAVKTGISAGVSDSIQTGGTVFPGLDYTFGSKSINNLLARLGRNSSLNLGRVTPNFYVSLSALENNSNVEVRSVPKLSTLNGHVANLSIGSKRYYSTRTQNVIPSLTTQTVVTEQFTAVDANLDINIRPVVSGDDQVTLTVKVAITDFIGDPPLNAPPPTSTSKFESIVRAKNEDMIVLGGIERTESSESGSGVPVLSRIPILKWLFSSRTKSNNKVVTVVFIKPTIIY